MTDEEKIAWLSGQIAVLGIAIQKLLATHPDKAGIAAAIDNDYEQHVSSMVHKPVPDAYLTGMKHALDLYLLKNPEHLNK